MFKGILEKGEQKDFFWKDFTLSVTQNESNDLFTVAVSREESFYVSGHQLWDASARTNYNKYGAGTIQIAHNIGYGSVPCNKLKLFIWTGTDDEHYEVTIYTNKKTSYLYTTVQYRSVDEFGKIESKFLPYRNDEQS